MKDIVIHKNIKAWQWDVKEKDLPEGFHLCQPEVHYSAARDCVYFTFADLMPSQWISTAELTEKPPSNTFNGVFKMELKDGRVYYREMFSFRFYEIKSEASARRDYTPVYLNTEDEKETRAFIDFGIIEKWFVAEDIVKVLPSRIEYRQTDGSYGRGFKPYYMKPGEWIVIDGKEIKVMTDPEFKALQG